LGLVFVVVQWSTQGVAPGPITAVVCVVVSGLTVATVVAKSGRVVVTMGWLTSVALALEFLGAVADRFGVFGGPGSPGVWWGSWSAFVDNTTQMLRGVTGWPAQAVAVSATSAEVVLGVALLLGWQRRWVGKATAGLLTVYAVLMVTSVGASEVARFALPVLVGGALVLSATPRTLTRHSRTVAGVSSP
jgi:uncharacterized membrane protein YphA (DoxX/SURF4 family)